MTTKQTDNFGRLIALTGMDMDADRFLGMRGVNAARVELSSEDDHYAELILAADGLATMVMYRERQSWTKEIDAARAALDERDRIARAKLFGEPGTVEIIDLGRTDAPSALAHVLQYVSENGGLATASFEFNMKDGETLLCRVGGDVVFTIDAFITMLPKRPHKHYLEREEIDKLLTKYNAAHVLPAFPLLCLAIGEAA